MIFIIIGSMGLQKVRRNLFEGKGEVEIEHLFTADEFEAPVRFCARVRLAPVVPLDFTSILKKMNCIS